MAAPPMNSRSHGSNDVLNTAILPALRLAKVGAAGLGPGIEGLLNGIFELATMVSVR